jgi:hypothetical protein
LVVIANYNTGSPQTLGKVMTKKLKSGLAAGLTGLALAATQASALNLTVDQILAPGDVDPTYLSGTVDVSYTSIDATHGTLTITLKNTSGDAAGSGAGILLTGLGFVLDDYISIDGGTAVTSGSAVGFTMPAGGVVSSEWGYDESPLNSGALLNTLNPVNTAVSSMESQTTSQFAAGSIASPPNLDGPDFGLISANETDGLGSGVEGILDSIVITLNLSIANTQGGKNLNNLESEINAAWVVLTFGSPGDGGTSVPDGGTGLALMGLAMTGLAGFKRYFAKK